jgi:hypothetical protein
VAPSINAAPLYFILGPSYHGTSALAWRLNLHPDIFSLGTGNPLRREDPQVSDGSTVSTSDFWKAMYEAVKTSEEDPIQNLLPQSPYVAANPKLNLWINSILAVLGNETNSKSWRFVFEQTNRFIGIHDRFLDATREWVPHKAFVDAERSNLKFMTLASMGFPVKGIVHMVRDPRGYVAAWKKYYPESTVEKLTMEWAAAHTRINRLAVFFPKVAFMTMTYEELMEKPGDSFNKIVNFMGLPEAPYGGTPAAGKNNLLGIGPQDQALEPISVAGNWRETLSPQEEARILRVAGPLFSEFGYKSENTP